MLKAIRDFTRLFWIANTLEVFERLAFYGSKAVLAYYLVTKIGLDNNTAGWLVGTYSGLIFGLPIVAGVVVDRYGFRRTLVACFTLFTLGYTLVGLAGMPAGAPLRDALGKTGYAAFALLVTAIGGSLIKPCIVGTVERTTDPERRPLGFSIYYALVNLGGAIGPLIASQVRALAGIEWVFIMSAGTSALLVFGTLAFFSEPPGGSAGKSFPRLFRDMLTVFSNTRFVLFLAIFSGFWIMFWQIFYSLPFYIAEVLKFERFEVFETIDSWTIILLSVPLTALANKIRPIRAMALGLLIAGLSWLPMIFSRSLLAAGAGLAIFAVGESLQAPRFYDYVASLAPKDQLGTYMGFAFLPIAVGAFTAGPLSGWLVTKFMHETFQPATMWAVVASIGLVTTVLLVAYDWVFRPRASAAA
jgi:proton-dependent oligopeptide transporter, POT family